MDYQATANKVLDMLKHADGNDPSRGHLTMNNWEWPTGVALYGIYKTYQQSGDKALSLIHISDHKRRNANSYALF